MKRNLKIIVFFYHCSNIPNLISKKNKQIQHTIKIWWEAYHHIIRMINGRKFNWVFVLNFYSWLTVMYEYMNDMCILLVNVIGIQKKTDTWIITWCKFFMFVINNHHHHHLIWWGLTPVRCDLAFFRHGSLDFEKITHEWKMMTKLITKCINEFCFSFVWR